MGLLWVDTSLWDCIATYTTRLITTMTLYSHNTYGASKLSGAKPSSKSNVKNDTNISYPSDVRLLVIGVRRKERVCPRWYFKYCSLSMNGFRSRPRRPFTGRLWFTGVFSLWSKVRRFLLKIGDSNGLILIVIKIIVGQQTDDLDTGILKMLEAITWWNICFRTDLSSNRVLRV